MSLADTVSCVGALYIQTTYVFEFCAGTLKTNAEKSLRLVRKWRISGWRLPYCWPVH